MLRESRAESRIQKQEKACLVQGISLKIERNNAVSDASGYYELKNLAAGEYEIIVRYVGYKEVQKKITLKENEVLLLDFKLVEENLNLTNVDVFGTLNKEEETASRLSEKNADNIITVISSRAMERFS